MARYGRSQPFAPIIKGIRAAASSNLTLALTGVAMTCTAGALGVSLTIGLTGIAATASPGTVVYNAGGDKTVALTGISATLSAGTIAPSTTLPLTGIATTSSAGSVTPSYALALTGSAATVSAGTVTATGGVIVVLGPADACDTFTVPADGGFSVAGDPLAFTVSVDYPTLTVPGCG